MDEFTGQAFEERFFLLFMISAEVDSFNKVVMALLKIGEPVGAIGSGEEVIDVIARGGRENAVNDLGLVGDFFGLGDGLGEERVVELNHPPDVGATGVEILFL